MAAGVFSFVFGRIAQLPSDGLPYFVFSYAGLLGWNLFSGTLTKTSGCLVGNAQLISKIYFPRLVLPISSVPSVLLDFGVALGMMGALLMYYRIPLTSQVLMLPIWMGILLLLAMGFGLVTAALAVTYRDVSYILPVFMQILMYASPIAYGLAYALKRIPPQYHAVYLLNPLVAPLEAFRGSLLGVAFPPAPALLCAAASSLAIFFVGAYSFKKMERKFADVI
jgi:lipopolysaccharide transport system permease protein